MRSLYTLEVHVTVNNIEILNVAQQCFYGDFVSPRQQKTRPKIFMKSTRHFCPTVTKFGVSR
jgi:hypothetical protein